MYLSSLSMPQGTGMVCPEGHVTAPGREALGSTSHNKIPVYKETRTPQSLRPEQGLGGCHQKDGRNTYKTDKLRLNEVVFIRNSKCGGSVLILAGGWLIYF